MRSFHTSNSTFSHKICSGHYCPLLSAQVTTQRRFICVGSKFILGFKRYYPNPKDFEYSLGIELVQHQFEFIWPNQAAGRCSKRQMTCSVSKDSIYSTFSILNASFQTLQSREWEQVLTFFISKPRDNLICGHDANRAGSRGPDKASSLSLFSKVFSKGHPTTGEG